MPQVAGNHKKVYHTILETVVAAYEKNKKIREKLVKDIAVVTGAKKEILESVGKVGSERDKLIKKI